MQEIGRDSSLSLRMTWRYHFLGKALTKGKGIQGMGLVKTKEIRFDI
jgi:hypothetical protein